MGRLFDFKVEDSFVLNDYAEIIKHTASLKNPIRKIQLIISDKEKCVGSWMVENEEGLKLLFEEAVSMIPTVGTVKSTLNITFEIIHLLGDND